MKTDLDAFLNEGVDRYVEAKRLLEVFRAELVVRLKDIPLAKSNWGKFQVGKTGSAGEKLSKSIGDSVWATVRGENSIGNVAEIEYGVWWNAPKTKAPFVIYAYIYEPAAYVNFTYDGHVPDVKVFVDNGFTFLYLTPNGGTDLTVMMSTLLEQVGHFVG